VALVAFAEEVSAAAAAAGEGSHRIAEEVSAGEDIHRIAEEVSAGDAAGEGSHRIAEEPWELVRTAEDPEVVVTAEDAGEVGTAEDPEKVRMAEDPEEVRTAVDPEEVRMAEDLEGVVRMVATWVADRSHLDHKETGVRVHSQAQVHILGEVHHNHRMVSMAEAYDWIHSIRS